MRFSDFPFDIAQGSPLRHSWGVAPHSPQRDLFCISTLAPKNLGIKSQERLDRKQYNDTIVLVNYVTTNIRISEEDYLRLKAEAAKQRTSLSAVVREKIKSKPKERTKAEVKKIMAETEKLARENAKYTKGFDSVKALREIRYNGKW